MADEPVVEKGCSVAPGRRAGSDAAGGLAETGDQQAALAACLPVTAEGQQQRSAGRPAGSRSAGVFLE